MSRVQSNFCTWLRDEYGSVTIEFMLWLPILAFWLVISVVFFDAYKARDDAMKTAQTLSDILSRQTEVTEEFIDSLFLLQSKLLARAPAGARMRVSSIQFRDDEYQVLWSRALGGGDPIAIGTGDDNELAQDNFPQMAELDTIILTELHVPYVPFSDWTAMDVTQWSFAVISRPRFVTAVAMVE
jgi:Flp pilus assembly protein TadG